MHHELRERFDIKDGGCSPATQLGKAVENRFQIVFIGKRALKVVNPSDPMREAFLLENGTSHDREVKMAVGVDETRHKNALAKVFAFLRSEVPGTAYCNDPVPAEMDIAVFNRRAAQGQYDACA